METAGNQLLVGGLGKVKAATEIYLVADSVTGMKEVMEAEANHNHLVGVMEMEHHLETEEIHLCPLTATTMDKHVPLTQNHRLTMAMAIGQHKHQHHVPLPHDPLHQDPLHHDPLHHDQPNKLLPVRLSSAQIVHQLLHLLPLQIREIR